MPDLRNWLARARPRKQRHALVGRSDLWQMKRAFQIDFLRANGLRPGHHLLDIGCGSLRGGAALIEYLDPGRYTGVDVREEALAEARQEMARENLTGKRPNIVLASDGLNALRFTCKFDVVWAFSVLFHLGDEILETCFALAEKYLEPDAGVFYANVIVGDGPPGQWQGFPVMPRNLETYEALGRRHGMRTERLGLLSGLGHHSGHPSQDGQTMLAFRVDSAERARVPAT
jgi:SAM-dependent methyltransferase